MHPYSLRGQSRLHRAVVAHSRSRRDTHSVHGGCLVGAVVRTDLTWVRGALLYLLSPSLSKEGRQHVFGYRSLSDAWAYVEWAGGSGSGRRRRPLGQCGPTAASRRLPFHSTPWPVRSPLPAVWPSFLRSWTANGFFPPLHRPALWDGPVSHRASRSG